MSDQTLKAAVGAALFTLLFFLLIAFQPLLLGETFSPDDASASPPTMETASDAPSAPNLQDAALSQRASSR